jgi:hypothetical protein
MRGTVAHPGMITVTSWRQLLPHKAASVHPAIAKRPGRNASRGKIRKNPPILELSGRKSVYVKSLCGFRCRPQSDDAPAKPFTRKRNRNAFQAKGAT